MILAAIDIIENDRVLLNTQPKCEPALGRRGLYGTVGGNKSAAELNMAMLWVLNLSDGSSSLLDIAERSGLTFAVINAAAGRLEQAGLLAVPANAP